MAGTGIRSACGRSGGGRILSLLCLLCLASNVIAKAPVVLDLQAEALALSPYIELLEDPGGELGIDAVRERARAGGFSALGERSTSLGYSTSAWWVRLVLRNPQSTPQGAVLRLAYPLLDHLDVYVFEGGRPLQQWRTGDRLPFASRPIPHRDFLFPLQLPAAGEQEIYLRASSGGPVNLTLSLYPERQLLPALGSELLLLGALLGSVALLALCVLLLWLVVRDAAFLHYLFYLLAYGGYLAVFNGLAYQYVWPESPQLAGVLQVVLLMAALFFLVQFSRVLLRIAEVAPRLDRVNRLLQGLTLLLMLAAPWFSYATLIRPISLATMWSMLMVLCMGIVALRAGEPTARFYLLAWSAFLAGVVAYMFKSFGWLPHNLVTQYGFQIGTVFEFVLLSVALGIRVQALRQQSRTDALTGLGNRSRFDELIETRFAQHAVSEQPLSLLVVDVDHFKQVNDAHGHAVGDRVLQQVGATLRRALGGAGEACRYGGEEFVILLPRCELGDARRIAEQLRLAVASELRDPALTVSIGVACTRHAQFADPRALFRAADEALYAAKRGGRDRVEQFSAAAQREPPAAILT